MHHLLNVSRVSRQFFAFLPGWAEVRVDSLQQELFGLAVTDGAGAVTVGQFGFLGEPRVNVLELNLDLDATHPRW